MGDIVVSPSRALLHCSFGAFYTSIQQNRTRRAAARRDGTARRLGRAHVVLVILIIYGEGYPTTDQ